MDNSHRLDGSAVTNGSRAGYMFSDSARATRVLIGNRELQACLTEIRQLRRHCGQQDDLTTDPEYFIAANTLKNRRCAAVLVRREKELEACVLFYEHTRFGLGLGLFRGGDYIGESLVAGSEAFRVNYVHLATEALLRKRRVHGVSISIKAPVERCIDVMGPASHYRRFLGTEIRHKLALENTYEGMLASLGPRTRRSLAGKRQQLEKSAQVSFVPALTPEKSLEAMLALEAKAVPQRIQKFFHVRDQLIRSNPEFFSMGLQLPDGSWLSVLTGWRRNRVTYVDLQLNDKNYKKESISAVMRAYMLEHEIGLGQESINFVGGSSLLLRRYCEPMEPCTDIFISKPCLRAKLFEMVATLSKQGSVYERLKPGVQIQTPSESES